MKILRTTSAPLLPMMRLPDALISIARTPGSKLVMGFKSSVINLL